jgi:hypothetical protein
VTPLRDLRHGVRILAKHPTFAMAALSIMALGIGASRGRIVRQLLAEGGVIGVVGVYGVVAYATAGRTREIAVRLALGADGRRIVGLVIRDGLGWTAAGVRRGALGALALSRYLSSLLSHVGEHDAMTYLSVAMLLVVVAIVPTATPAVRAVRVNPMLTLRSEGVRRLR